MPEFYEYESSCSRCLRSSPLASLLLMILVFLGGTAFGVGTIFGRKRLVELLDVDHLFPYMDYAVYAIVGATGFFVIIVYIICAVSSGWNAKRCFEGSRATHCGRCMNSTLLVCLVMGVLFWTLVACLLSYPVMSSALLLYRDEGPARSVANAKSSARVIRQINEDFNESMVTESLPPPRVGALDVDPSEVRANFFACDPTKVDLSYYGLYDKDDKPMMLDSKELSTKLRNPLIFACAALFGSIIIIFAYICLTCTVEMNYARLKEMRYYEPSVNDDETIRLRH